MPARRSRRQNRANPSSFVWHRTQSEGELTRLYLATSFPRVDFLATRHARIEFKCKIVDGSRDEIERATSLVKRRRVNRDQYACLFWLRNRLRYEFAPKTAKIPSVRSWRFGRSLNCGDPGWRRAKLCVSASNTIYCLGHACLQTPFRTRPVAVYHLERISSHEAL